VSLRLHNLLNDGETDGALLVEQVAEAACWI